MLDTNQLSKINTYLNSKRFTFNDEIIPGIVSDIVFTFKISGYKEMISIGDWVNYALLDVKIIEANDPVSKLLFNTNEGVLQDHLFQSKFNHYFTNLNNHIRTSIMDFIDPGTRTTIMNLSSEVSESENITESMSRISKIAVRTSVKDILNIIKKGVFGEFYLPGEDGEEYSFTNLPFTFSIILLLTESNDEGIIVDGNFSSENDVVEISVSYNRKTLKKDLYNLIGELNDVVAHELEHGFQYYRGEIKRKVKTKSPYDYYSKPHEIKSQKVGLRRLSKLKKQPYEKVVREWFDTHQDIHQLTIKEQSLIIKKILS